MGRTVVLGSQSTVARKMQSTAPMVRSIFSCKRSLARLQEVSMCLHVLAFAHAYEIPHSGVARGGQGGPFFQERVANDYARLTLPGVAKTAGEKRSCSHGAFSYGRHVIHARRRKLISGRSQIFRALSWYLPPHFRNPGYAPK